MLQIIQSSSAESFFLHMETSKKSAAGNGDGAVPLLSAEPDVGLFKHKTGLYWKLHSSISDNRFIGQRFAGDAEYFFGRTP